MTDRFKKLLAETSIYTIGNVFLRSFSIVTMPVFTRYMSTSQYGMLSIIRTVRDFLVLIYEAGTPAASMRLFYDCSSITEERQLFSSLFIFTTGLGVLMSGLFILLGFHFWPVVIKGIPFHPYGTLTLFTALMMTAGILPRTLFRAKGLAKLFVMINFLQALLIVLASVVLVVIYDMGALGPVAATFGVSIPFSFIYIKYLKPYLLFSFSWKVVRQALSFGLPECPVRLGNWALRMSNNLILQYFVPLSIIGVYSVGYAVGSVVFELTMSGIHSAILPFYYQTAKEESPEVAKQIFAIAATYTLAVILFLSLFTVFMGKLLLLLFASAKYADAHSIVMIIAISCIFQFVFFIPSRGLYIMKRTSLFPPLLFITVGISVAMSFILIPAQGVMGAAWATLGAYLIRSILTFVISQRIFYVPYHYLKMGKAFFAFAVILLIGLLLPEGHMIVQLSIRLFLLTLFPVLLYFLGFFENAELAYVVSRWRSFKKGLLAVFPCGLSHRCSADAPQK